MKQNERATALTLPYLCIIKRGCRRKICGKAPLFFVLIFWPYPKRAYGDPLAYVLSGKGRALRAPGWGRRQTGLPFRWAVGMYGRCVIWRRDGAAGSVDGRKSGQRISARGSVKPRNRRERQKKSDITENDGRIGGNTAIFAAKRVKSL